MNYARLFALAVRICLYAIGILSLWMIGIYTIVGTFFLLQIQSIQPITMNDMLQLHGALFGGWLGEFLSLTIPNAGLYLAFAVMTALYFTLVGKFKLPSIESVLTSLTVRLQRKHPAVANYIAIFIFSMILFSFIWAVLGYEVFPQYEQFQTTYYPTGSFNADQLTFMNSMVVWFPLCILWAGAIYLWTNAQQKNGGQDFPG